MSLFENKALIIAMRKIKSFYKIYTVLYLGHWNGTLKQLGFCTIKLLAVAVVSLSLCSSS